MLKKCVLVVLLLWFSSSGCAGDSIFQPISLSTTTPVLSQPIFMAVDEARARGYLINSDNYVRYSDASLLVLDLTDPLVPTVVAATSLKHFSGQAYLDTTTQILYIANRLSSDKVDENDQILRVNVDEASAGFLTIDEFGAGNDPFGVASDGTNLFVVNEKSLDSYLLSDLDHRTQVDFSTLTAVGDPLTVDHTREVALSPSGQYLFATNRGERLQVINVSEIASPDTSLSVTLAGSEPVDYVLNNTDSTRGIASDSSYLYVVEGNPPALKVLSENNLPQVSGNPQEILISSLAVAEIPLGEDPNEIAIDETNHRAYVALTQESEISVIDTQLLVEVARVSVKDSLTAGLSSGETPFGVSVVHSGANTYVYVLNHETDNISILDAATLSIVATFP